MEIDSEIVENTKKQEPNSGLKLNSNFNIIRHGFKRFGLIKFLYQDFPSLDVIPSNVNAVSLIFLRRVPPGRVLNQLMKSSSKVIFCLHGIALEKIRITNPLIIAHQILMRLKLRNLAQYAKNHIFIQCVLPTITSYLVSHGADLKNIFTIENELESDINFPNRNDEEFQVTFIGRMENLQKGIKRLKKVIQFVWKLDNMIKFNVIGTGKDVRILNELDGNVSFFNEIDDQKKNEIISFSNLALVTSNLEPFSFVTLEFLTLGVPVVTTPVSGPSYILSKDLSFGKVASFSARSLAKSIYAYYNEWARDKEQYFSKRKDLYHKSRKIFNSKNMLESYRSMIVQVGTKK